MVKAVIVAVFASIVFYAIFAFLTGWAFMLAVQTAHDHWLPVVPTIGYWWAVLLMFFIRVAFINPGNSND